MLNFIIFLFILGILIVVHEFGHFMAAKRIGVKVEKFSMGFGPKLFSKKIKDTQYMVSLIPLGGYVKLAGDNLEEYKKNKYDYFYQAPGRRFWIIVFGPLLNYFLGFLFFWVIFAIGYPTFTTKVGGLKEGFGAQKAGIKAGDKITAVDGQPVAYWEELQKIIQSKKASSVVKISFLRGSEESSVDVNIKQDSMDDLLGKKRSVSLLGISPSDEIMQVKHSVFKSFFLGWNKTWELTAFTYRAFWSMITGKMSFRDSVTGIVGMYDQTVKVIKLGLSAFLFWMALLNISLAVFNLLPLPVLDGGHILFLAIEKIRGKTLSLKTDRIITQIGLTAIIGLALVVTYNDVMRLFGDKITKIFK